MVLGKSQGVRASSFAIGRVLEVPNLSWEMEGYQGIKICSSHHFSQITLLHHHTTGYHPHPGILQGGQQHPRAGPGSLPKQADYLSTPKETPCPVTPTRTLHSNMDTGKHPLFWGEGIMAVSTAQTAFVGFLPFKPKATITKNQKPLTFDKAFKFERGQEKVPRKGRETTFFKTF